MPAGGTAKSSNPSGRTTFRPPWVKEGSEVTDALINLKSVPKKSPPKETGDGNNNPIGKLTINPKLSSTSSFSQCMIYVYLINHPFFNFH